MSQFKVACICERAEKQIGYGLQEDKMLLDFLQAKRWDVQRVYWADDKINWKDFNLVIIKSPWDYHYHYERFMQWLSGIHDLGIQILNPYEIIRLNSDKHYLQQMEDERFDVIPSIFLESGKQHDLSGMFATFKTKQLIVKPCVSAGSKHTFIVTEYNIVEQTNSINVLTREESFIVQPFVEQIHEGELSYLFFGGNFSHCVLKKPQAGEFRVQLGFGGTIHLQNPSADEIEKAKSFVDRFATGCLHARVDGVMINGKFTLMELELIEPMLYFPDAPGSVGRYYDALTALTSRL
jgi:glutathione synthase/RimK-type ligase-like ATP-grasp enzyme